MKGTLQVTIYLQWWKVQLHENDFCFSKVKFFKLVFIYLSDELNFLTKYLFNYRLNFKIFIEEIIINLISELNII